MIIEMDAFNIWCPVQDLNLQELPQWILSPSRVPISPTGQNYLIVYIFVALKARLEVSSILYFPIYLSYLKTYIFYLFLKSFLLINCFFKFLSFINS